jgi:hypothetical protein
MSEVMTEIVEAEVGDEFPLLMIRLQLERAKPMMNTIFRQPSTALRSKHIRTLLVASPMLQIGLICAKLLGSAKEVFIWPEKLFCGEFSPVIFTLARFV